MGEVIEMEDYRPRLRAATTKRRVILDRSVPAAPSLPLAIWVMLEPWTFFWPDDWGTSK